MSESTARKQESKHSVVLNRHIERGFDSALINSGGFDALPKALKKIFNSLNLTTSQIYLFETVQGIYDVRGEGTPIHHRELNRKSMCRSSRDSLKKLGYLKTEVVYYYSADGKYFQMV